MPEGRVLDVLGVGEGEELLYRALLGHPGATAEEVRILTGFSGTRVRSLLGSLEKRALISRRSGRPARFQAAPPDAAVEALASAREEQISRARLEVPRLMELLRAPTPLLSATDLVEVLTSREALVERWMQLQRATRTSLEGFTRLPVAQPNVNVDEGLQSALYNRGVSSRVIYDQAALGAPGVLDHVRRMASMGEHARVVKDLPMKLALFDRRVAMVPTMSTDSTAVEAALVVHRCALQDALIALFEIYWHRGSQIHVLDPKDADGGQPDEILGLLAAGLKDDAIARHLGLSTVTVRRRIAGALESLEVDSRFQAGLALGRVGWPDEGPFAHLSRTATDPGSR